MFTPNIKSVDKQNGKIRLIVIFSNGVDLVEEEFVLSNTQIIKNLLRSRGKQLDDLYSLADGTNTGPFDITVPEQTQADLDKEEFLKDYNKLVGIKRAIDLGVLTGSEPQIMNLKNKVIATFKPSYIDLL